jgi:hypothetical protein
MVNRFDEIVRQYYSRTPPEERDFRFHDTVVDSALRDILREMPAEEADRVIFRSAGFSSIGLGTALRVQQSVILQLLDKAGL